MDTSIEFFIRAGHADTSDVPCASTLSAGSHSPSDASHTESDA